MLKLVCEEKITVFFRTYDISNRKDVWHIKQLSGVSWFGGQLAVVADRGLNTADKYTVRIPESLTNGYVAEKDFDGQGDTWTIQHGGYIVLGLIDEIPEKISELSNRTSMVVTGVYDNRRGSMLRHIKVEGK